MATAQKTQEMEDSAMAPEKLTQGMLERERLRCLGYFIHKVMDNVNGYLQNLSMLSEILAEGQQKQDRFIRSRHPESHRDWERLSLRQQKRLGLLARQTAEMGDRMRDLMLLGESESHEKEVHMNLFLTKLAEAFRLDLVVRHGVKLDLQLADDLPMVRVHGSHLIPALMHLVHNALTAMKSASEKRLTVRSRYQKGFICVDFMASSRGNGKNHPQSEETVSPMEPEPAASLTRLPAEDEYPGLDPLAVERLLSPCAARIRLRDSFDGILTTLEIPIVKQRLLK